MASTKPGEKRDIRSILSPHLGHRTVLGIAIPVLAGHIAATKSGSTFRGLTEHEIEVGFRQIASTFIKSEYHSTYIDRRLGPRGFLELDSARYRLREAALQGLTLDDLEALHAELITSLRTAYEQRQAVIRRLEETCSLPKDSITERHALVNTYLSQIAGNRGEMFEVISFAVLCEYFRTFGFSLQRFSTTHANDGGMDFVAGEAIYQVTTDESIQKIRRDLTKAPGTKRVLVRPTAAPEAIQLSENEVLETIDLQDLLQHFIGWLTARDTRANQAKHLQKVLQIALREFQRENNAESA